MSKTFLLVLFLILSLLFLDTVESKKKKNKLRQKLKKKRLQFRSCKAELKKCENFSCGSSQRCVLSVVNRTATPLCISEESVCQSCPSCPEVLPVEIIPEK